MFLANKEVVQTFPLGIKTANIKISLITLRTKQNVFSNLHQKHNEFWETGSWGFKEMSSKQTIVRLPLDVIKSILQTEAKMDRFLAKQAQKWELEGLA